MKQNKRVNDLDEQFDWDSDVGALLSTLIGGLIMAVVIVVAVHICSYVGLFDENAEYQRPNIDVAPVPVLIPDFDDSEDYDPEEYQPLIEQNPPRSTMKSQYHTI